MRLCRLERIRGRVEACPEDHCPFWEPGGAVVEGGCAFERVGLRVDPELANWLLEIRATLESARTRAEQSETLRLYHRLLNDACE
jgi:hypothetical protein